MENNHRLGLYVSYYLSRFNKNAYKNLRYGNMLQTHIKIGKILSVPANTVKNWRDEFDPLFGYRAGWHKRPMIMSRVKVAEAFQNLNESEIQSIVIDILSGKVNENINELQLLVELATEKINETKSDKFILRGPTGKAAEEYFIEYYSQFKKPIEGKLIDCRDFGVGYDFKIESIDKFYLVEVKGLSDFCGGVLFTNKEWIVANEMKEIYYLCIIRNVNGKPEITFIQNPATKINPKRNISTVIQISWIVSDKVLKEIE